MAASAKHRLGFREKLGLYALALLLIGAALLGYLWFALDRYESNTPESSVRRYLQETAAGQWETILQDAEADLSPLDRPEDYTAWLTEVYAGLPEEYTLVRTSGGEGQTYALMDGSREVSRLILTPAPAESGRSWQVRTLAEPLPPVEILAPEGCTVQVNGTPLGSEYRTGSQAAAGYESLPQGYEAPQAEAYRIEGLLMEPEITAVTANGSACTVAAPTEGEVRTVSVTTPVPEAQAGEYWAAAEQAAKTYAAFISSDAGRGELKALLLPGTEFWQAMQEFYNGWYIDHTGYAYENLQRLSLTSAGENAFTAELSFDYLVYRGAREYRYLSRYRLDFLKTANGWKVVRIATL